MGMTAVLAFTYQQFEDWMITWSPIIFMALIVFFLWRTIKLMPKTKPQEIKASSSRSRGWEEVSGADEAKHELNRTRVPGGRYGHGFCG